MISSKNILENLNTLFFIREGEKGFSTVYESPAWFQQLYVEKFSEHSLDNEKLEGDLFDLTHAFPFLKSFICEANYLWGTKKYKDVVCSGVWIEDFAGEEIYLEAEAKFFEKTPLLEVNNLSKEYQRHAGTYQNFRELCLINEKLKSEIHFQQQIIHHDISSYMERYGSIKKLLNAMQSSSLGVFVFDENGNVKGLNRALTKMYDLAADYQDVKERSLLEQWLKESKTDYSEMAKTLLVDDGVWESDFYSETAHGNTRIRLSICAFQEDGALYHVCLLNEVEVHEDLESTTLSTADISLVTQLPNRNAFWKILERNIETCNDLKQDLALIIFNIDDFGQVNVEIGHDEGDILLAAIASRISRIVKHSDSIVHLGADEFGMIMRPVYDPRDISGVVKRLQESVKMPVCLDDGSPVAVSASAGVVRFPQDEILDAHGLYKAANVALKYAKKQGRNSNVFYSPRLMDSVQDKLKREQEIRRAIANEEFILAFQPSYSLQDNAVNSVEALARWDHPEKGVLTPYHFMEIAEESGLIIDLGQWVLELVFRKIKALEEKNLPAKVSVNISPQQIEDPYFLAHLLRMISTYEINNANLEIEITENVFFKNPEKATKLLNKVRSLGISLALDDFGTGFSSLAHLQQLPINTIKIDRDFIIGLPNHINSKKIVTSIIDLAHKMDIKVVAEGVETSRQIAFLTEHGCDYVQGYLKSEPMLEEALLEHLTE